MQPESPACVTITIQPFFGLWEVFELPGAQPQFSSRLRAIEAARHLLKHRSGIIEIYQSDGLLDEVIDLRTETRIAATV